WTSATPGPAEVGHDEYSSRTIQRDHLNRLAKHIRIFFHVDRRGRAPFSKFGSRLQPHNPQTRSHHLAERPDSKQPHGEIGMAAITVTNWFGDVVSHPAVVVDAETADDIVKVMTQPTRYPSPVRAVGSNHSTTPCGAIEGGTLVRM